MTRYRKMLLDFAKISGGILIALIIVMSLVALEDGDIPLIPVLSTIIIIIILFIICFIAALFGERSVRKEEKKEALDVPIQMRWGIVVVVSFAWFLSVVPVVLLIMDAFCSKMRDTPIPPDLLIALVSILAYLAIYMLVIFPFTAKRAAKGRIRVDDTGARWNIGKENGCITWDRPFKVEKGKFSKQIHIYLQNLYALLPIRVSFISYRITQDGKQVTFYHDAPLVEIEGLPEVARGGIYLHSHGRLVMQRILGHAR